MRKSNTKVSKLNAVALAVALGSSAAVVAPAASAATTGNIGVFSQYILRGITNSPESNTAALQGGVDWSGDSGVYLGYWGSNLDYSDKSARGFENDLYGGYAGSVGKINYDLGLIYYAYVNVNNSDAFEVKGRLGYGPVTAGFNYLTKDVAWGNQGDIYWTLAYSQPLPKDFSLGLLASYYTYKKGGKYVPETPASESSAFRDFEVSLSHPIGKTGADMSLTYIFGGKNRYGVSQDNAMVFGLTYGFDI